MTRRAGVVFAALGLSLFAGCKPGSAPDPAAQQEACKRTAKTAEACKACCRAAGAAGHMFAATGGASAAVPAGSVTDVVARAREAMRSGGPVCECRR
jgi:hypothetical protein